MFKSVDERFEALGYKKVVENPYCARYERRTEYGYVHVVVIARHNFGKHVIRSFDLKTNKDGNNDMVGMTEPVAKLALKKLRELKKKYMWEATK